MRPVLRTFLPGLSVESYGSTVCGSAPAPTVGDDSSVAPFPSWPAVRRRTRAGSHDGTWQMCAIIGIAGLRPLCRPMILQRAPVERYSHSKSSLRQRRAASTIPTTQHGYREHSESSTVRPAAASSLSLSLLAFPITLRHGRVSQRSAARQHSETDLDRGHLWPGASLR